MNRKDLGKISVIVSTYNRCDALQVCLLSLFKQTVLPDEVIIGDDGSTEETASLIARLQEQAPFPIIHVWHEDNVTVGHLLPPQWRIRESYSH